GVNPRLANKKLAMRFKHEKSVRNEKWITVPRMETGNWDNATENQRRAHPLACRAPAHGQTGFRALQNIPLSK
ncbi:MAG: hypothetical protein LBI02_11470, partial [Opitutaceae bacterium]|nr:hypothetical protein [Opitutaceae bacterium]